MVRNCVEVGRRLSTDAQNVVMLLVHLKLEYNGQNRRIGASYSLCLAAVNSWFPSLGENPDIIWTESRYSWKGDRDKLLQGPGGRRNDASGSGTISTTHMLK